jgi:hypothetical protein
VVSASDGESHHARVARNESIFREANEGLRARYAELEPVELSPFLCECGDERCTRVVRLTDDEYEEVRAHPARFVVLPGHQILEVEHVVERNDRFDVVEKIDVGEDVARTTDPR